MATASPTTTGTTLAAEPHAFRNEEDLQEAYHANGWTDGLPRSSRRHQNASRPSWPPPDSNPESSSARCLPARFA